MRTMDWNELMLNTTFYIYCFLLSWRNPLSNPTRHNQTLLDKFSVWILAIAKAKNEECKLEIYPTIFTNNFKLFWILIKLNLIPILICWKKISQLRIYNLLFRWDFLPHKYSTFLNDNSTCNSYYILNIAQISSSIIHMT